MSVCALSVKKWSPYQGYDKYQSGPSHITLCTGEQQAGTKHKHKISHLSSNYHQRDGSFLGNHKTQPIGGWAKAYYVKHRYVPDSSPSPLSNHAFAGDQSTIINSLRAHRSWQAPNLAADRLLYIIFSLAVTIRMLGKYRLPYLDVPPHSTLLSAWAQLSIDGLTAANKLIFITWRLATWCESTQSMCFLVWLFVVCVRFRVQRVKAKLIQKTPPNWLLFLKWKRISGKSS